MVSSPYPSNPPDHRPVGTIDGAERRRRQAPSRADAAALLISALVAFAYTFGVFWYRAQLGEGQPSYDIYAQHYPNLIYALRSLRQGYGLLWNNLQDCGRPFVPSTQLGLFYPLHALFLIVGLDTGFLLVTLLHLAIAGVGTYYLCREYGVGALGALCAALNFQVSGPTVYLAGWLPTSILGVYVWMPVAMLLLERLLKAPSIGKGIWLGVVLTLQLLPGMPQILLFTYQ